MRVSGSSAARVWRMTQYASLCPHLSHLAFVLGRVSVFSSMTSIPWSSFMSVTMTSLPSDFLDLPHLLHCHFPSTGVIMDLHFGQNIRLISKKVSGDKKVTGCFRIVLNIIFIYRNSCHSHKVH